MGRFWSLLFLLVPVIGVAVFVMSAAGIKPFVGMWLPEDISEHGHAIDGLFMFILYLTGVIFVITGIVISVFLWRYDAAHNTEPVKFIHGNHTLEIVWSILPSVVLLFIAILQMETWASAKMIRPKEPGPDNILGTDDDVDMPALAKVTGRQFEWRIQYAGEDRILGTRDDVYTVNDLHVPVNEPIVLRITSEDVLHSFFIPNVRIKQDVIPGMAQHIWFVPKKTGNYDIVCAELCGWGHYKMKGRLTVQTRDEFDEWLADLYAHQESTTGSDSE